MSSSDGITKTNSFALREGEKRHFRSAKDRRVVGFGIDGGLPIDSVIESVRFDGESGILYHSRDGISESDYICFRHEGVPGCRVTLVARESCSIYFVICEDFQ